MESDTHTTIIGKIPVKRVAAKNAAASKVQVDPAFTESSLVDPDAMLDTCTEIEDASQPAFEAQQEQHQEDGGGADHKNEDEQERRVAALLAADRAAEAKRAAAMTPNEMSDADLAGDVKKDVDRTHPGLTFFQKASTRDVICRILLIYARLNPASSHSQSGQQRFIIYQRVFAMCCNALRRVYGMCKE